jgi:precorrin-6B methylase 2
VADYALALSGAELARYRAMAQMALREESAELALAGVRSGATVADVGCGPAAMSVALAGLVGPSGRVLAVERDPQARTTAAGVIAAAGAANVELSAGTATDTGLEPGSVDVAMLRHVLAHNGGHEQDIVTHLASRVRPGGFVYLVDVDLTAVRLLDADPDLHDLQPKYVAFHRARGNDPAVGLRLSQLLSGADLEVRAFVGRYAIVPVAGGTRPPAWAAREALLADGIASAADIARWGAALDRMDVSGVKPTVFAPNFIALGQRS